MSEQAIQEIEALDAERCAATIAGNQAVLERLLSDDLRYTHSSAVAEDKATYLDRVCNGHYRYSGFTNLGRSVRVLGDVALVHGDVLIDVQVNNTQKRIHSRYLAVWRREGGRWQLLAWQSTGVPAA